MKIESIEDIKKFLGPTIFMRARNYYLEGAVLFIDVNPDDPSELMAVVAGSGRHEYEVDIDISRNYFFCDCPYPAACKHIGAVLLHQFYHDPSFFSEDIGNSREELASRILKSPERVFHLAAADNTGHSEVSLFGPDKIQEPQPGGFRLKLVIQKDDYTKKFELAPRACYIKKDGTQGRIEKYSPKKITEWDDDLQLMIADRLDAFEHASAPLHLFIETVLSCPHLFTVQEKRNKLLPLKTVSLNKFHFIADLMGINEKGPVFEAMIVSSDTENEEETVVLSPGDLMPRGLSHYAFAKNGSLVYYENNRGLFTLFDYLMNSHGMTIEEIRSLQKHCAEKMDPPVEVKIPHEEIRLVPVVPAIILQVERHYGFLDLAFFFRYGEVELPPHERERLVRVSPESDTKSLVLSTTRPIYERTVTREINSIIRAGEGYPFQGMHNGMLRVDDYDFSLFVATFGKLLFEKGCEVRLKGSSMKLSTQTGKVVTKISSGIDWFEGAIEYQFENEEPVVPLEFDPSLVIQGIIKSGDRYYVLSQNDVEKIMRLYREDLTGDGTFRVNKSNLSLIDELYAESVGEGREEMGEKSELYRRLLNIKKMPRYTLPKKFNAKLRKYQREGYRWLMFMEEHGLNGCLADDMGLGKTVQTLALLQKLKTEKRLGTSLIVVPVSTIPNWINEIERFTGGITVSEHIGPGRAREPEELVDLDIVITSYRTLARDIELFCEMDFHYLILDEAQNIKNSTSQTFKAVKSVSAKCRLSLTGTPVENNSGELWSQMDFLNPGLLGSRKSFQQKYARSIERDENSVIASDLRKITSPFILRRKKEDVALDLPEKEEIVYYTEMPPKQEKVYEAIRKEYKNEVEKTLDEQGVKKSAIRIFEALLRLRQAALLPGLIDARFTSAGSCKLDTLKEMVAEIINENHKVLVFSQFVKVLDVVREHFDEGGTPYAYIDGSTRKRAQQIKKFQEDENVKVFLLSLKAGGVGINLTAADYVIIFDPWWNPAVEAQAIDRSHRIGQTRKVIAYKYIVKNTIEEKILQLQEKKKKLVDEIISDESTLITSMSREEIMDLFE